MIAQRKKLYVFTGLTSVRQIFLRIFILEWTCNSFYLIGQLENWLHMLLYVMYTIYVRT